MLWAVVDPDQPMTADHEFVIATTGNHLQIDPKAWTFIGTFQIEPDGDQRLFVGHLFFKRIVS